MYFVGNLARILKIQIVFVFTRIGVENQQLVPAGSWAELSAALKIAVPSSISSNIAV
jgi:hypothetical protein